MKCPNCGTENKDQERVCKVCGESLLNPKDDSFSWVDTVDVWNGVEVTSESEKENEEFLENIPKKKRRRRESVEDYLEDDEQAPYLVQDAPLELDDEYDENDDDEEDIPRGSVQKTVLFILIGCLSIVLIIMLVVAFSLMRNDNNHRDNTSPVANSKETQTAPVTTEKILASEEQIITTEQAITTTEEEIITTQEEITTTEEEIITTQEETTPTESVENALIVQNGMSYQIERGMATLTDARSIGGAVIIPNQINGIPVTFIADNAFKGNTAVNRIVIPEGVITVGVDAFSGCASLTEIVIPNSVKLIGEGAFDYCPKFVIYCNAGSYADDFCKRWNVESRPIS